MISTLSLLAVISLGVSAALLPRQAPCSFVLNAVGIVNGSVLEDTIGENRIGGTYPQGSYITINNGLVDSLNHSCIISPSSSNSTALKA